MDRHAVVQCSLLYLAVIWLLMKEFCNSPPLTSFGSWAILCFKILIAIKKQLLRPAQEINRKNIYAPFETGDPGSQNWRKMWANNKTSFRTFIKNSMHTSMQRVRFGQKQYGTYFSDQRFVLPCETFIFLFENRHRRKLGCDQQIHCICDTIRLHRVKPISFPHQLWGLASRCFCFRHNCIICQSHTKKC